jgi:membrane protein required for colicin V production
MSLTPLDAIVIVVILVSAILAMVRGFVREVLSVASWVLAAVAAYYFYDDLAPYILDTGVLDNETAVNIIAAAAIFFVALIVATFITMRISDFVIDSRAGPVDRMLGFVFGGVRGVLLIVIAFMFFAWLVPERDQPDWIRDAWSKPMLEDVGERLIEILPEDIEQTIRDQLSGAARRGLDTPPGEAPAEGPAGAPGNDRPAGEQPAGAPPAAPADPGIDEDARDRLNQIFENADPN